MKSIPIFFWIKTKIIVRMHRQPSSSRFFWYNKTISYPTNKSISHFLFGTGSILLIFKSPFSYLLFWRRAVVFTEATLLSEVGFIDSILCLVPHFISELSPQVKTFSLQTLRQIEVGRLRGSGTVKCRMKCKNKLWQDN